MGKQSARLVYEGKDCYDIYHAGYYYDNNERPRYFWGNLSKMYLNGKMLWERLPPKFIFSDTYTDLHTSEKMKAISTFRNSLWPSLKLKLTEELETYSINGIEYIDGYYYILYYFSTIEYTKRKKRRWLLKSENGYDWEKVLDFEEEKTYVQEMKKYQGKLIFSTISFYEQEYIGLFLMDSDLNREQIFNAKEIDSSVKGINHLVIGDNIIICDLYVLRNKSYIGKIKLQTLQNITYEKKNKYFYGTAYAEEGYLLNVFRSKDGMNWTRFFYMDINKKGIFKILFSNGYMYLIDTDYAVYRTKDGTNIEKKLLIVESKINFFCIDDYFYFSFDKAGDYGTYKTKDFFKVQETSDGFTNAEKVKMAYLYLPELKHACCTDDNVAIYI